MKRRSRKRLGEYKPLDYSRLSAVPRSVSRGSEQYTVMVGIAAKKLYICPGCGVNIQVGQVHTVAWRSDSIMGAQADLDGRRHWHSHCWSRGLRAAN